MYCYGTIFHSAKVKVRYKRAVLTSLPFVGVDGQHVEHIAKQVSSINKIIFVEIFAYITLFFLEIKM